MHLVPEQFEEFKSQHPNTILIFRYGDFYEFFQEDAIIANKVLGLMLTTAQYQGTNIPLCGFPFEHLEGHLKRLLSTGYKVAII